MSEASLQVQIDAAKEYEAVMVPALFDDWVAPVLDAAGIRPGHKVLHVASGSTPIGGRALYDQPTRTPGVPLWWNLSPREGRPNRRWAEVGDGPHYTHSEQFHRRDQSGDMNWDR